jgi:hypothetical protein
MTVKQRSDNSARKHSGKRLMMRFGVPFCGNFFAVRKTFNLQSFLVFDAAAETNSVGSVGFLQRFFVVHNFYDKTLATNKHEKARKIKSTIFADERN